MENKNRKHNRPGGFRLRCLHVCWHCLHQCALANTGHAKMAHSLPQVMLFTPALNAFSRAVPDEKPVLGAHLIGFWGCTV